MPARTFSRRGAEVTSLQEIVIPVLKINKKRQSDTSAVDVDILRGATSVITSGQFAVVFYQTQPVSEKVLKELRSLDKVQTMKLVKL